MSFKYSVIEIYTSEEVRCSGKILSDMVMDHIRSLKIAARCMVFRGIEGFYEHGEVVSHKILNLSYNMPLKIEIILPSSELKNVLPTLESMVCEGIVGVREMNVSCHKTLKHLFPRQIRIKDVMSPSPKYVCLTTPVDEVVRLLLSSTFTGLPVVDDKNRPVGVISQGDLIYRAKMPLRLALMAKTAPETVDTVLESLSSLKAEEIMTRPAVHIQEDELLTGAVNLMLEKKVKRLPVVDASGKLTGILSRMNIFHTITQESPDWEEIQKQNIILADVRYVSDIMRRDTHTVLPDTSVEEVICMIDSDDIQRVAVVEADGRFLGIISDRNLLSAFSEYHPGIWEYLTRLIPFSEKTGRELKGQLRGKTAAQVMRTDLITVRENVPIDDAIALMTQKELKRLPVLDEKGRYTGMISREALLRAGFTKKEQ